MHTTTSRIVEFFVVFLAFSWSAVPLFAGGKTDSVSILGMHYQEIRKNGSGEDLAKVALDLARLHQQASQFAEAREWYTKAMGHLDSASVPKKWADFQMELANVHLKLGSLKEAQLTYHSAKNHYQKIDDTNKTAKLNERIAYIFLMQGMIGEAETLLRSAIKQLDNVENVDSSGLGDVFLTTGVLYSKKSDYVRAIHYYEKAEAVYTALGARRKLLFIYNNIASTYLGKGNGYRALDYLQKTLRLSEAFEFKPGVSSSLGNIAMIYLMLEDYQQALEYSERSKAINLEVGDSAQLGRIYSNQGVALQHLGRTDEAMEKLQESLSIRQQIGDRTGIGSSHLKLGSLYRKIGQYVPAEQHFKVSLSIWQEIGDQKSIAENYQEMGFLALARNQYRSAAKYCREGYEMAREENYAEELEETCNCLTKAYEAMGNYEMALKFHKNYTTARDSIMSRKKIQELTKMEMQYAFQSEKERIQLENEKEEMRLEAQIARQRLIRNVSLMGLVAGLLLIALLWRGYRQKRASNRLLSSQKNSIQEALEDRETLLREIHHRVKNNLQVISSLLSLQSRTTKDQTVLSAISEGRTRVEAMALIHQNLYQEDNLVGVDLPHYIEKLSGNLLTTYQIDSKNINITQDITPLTIDVDTVVPLALIINELISNSLKYAFNNRKKGRIHILINRKAADLLVSVRDDGIGLPADFQIDQSHSLGFKLVRSFVAKMKARLEIKSQSGTSINIYIPLELISQSN